LPPPPPPPARATTGRCSRATAALTTARPTSSRGSPAATTPRAALVSAAAVGSGWGRQRRWPDEALPPRGGEQEQVSWRKCAFNLHEDRRKSGSTSWVQHEYTVASPQCPFPVKLYHVAFTGHCQKRQHVPDDGKPSRLRASALLPPRLP